MGNCCLKKLLHEPNRPVSAVHITAEGTRVSKTVKAFERQHVLKKISPSDSPSPREAKSYKHDRRKTLARPKNSSAPLNKQIEGGTENGEERRHKRSSQGPNVTSAYQLRCFCYSVLKEATDNFSKHNFLGEGAFGDVFKGHLTFCASEAAKRGEGIPVAVKRLIRNRPQGYEAWKTEVDILRHLEHPNTVQLIGCCKEGTHKMLVYEFMDKGSLDTCLFRDKRRDLSWSRRIKIAIGAARGLAYLHNNAAKPVIHRDIKASNLLIDSKYNVKISDFGLAKYGPEDQDDDLITKIIGTKGYLAPEYANSGHLTAKADVYSFGVVLLEIMSGCSVDAKRRAGDLVQRAKRVLKAGVERELLSVFDARLGRSVPMKQAREFAEVTCRCLTDDPGVRPAMDEVLARLERLQPPIAGTGNTKELKLQIN